MERPKLIVIDDEPIRFVLERAFTLMGYSVTEVSSGEEALTHLDGDSYDLMILDLHLQGISGADIVSLGCKKWPHLPIIILTGHASVESAVSTLKSPNVVDYLQKSASLDTIVNAVADALHQQETLKNKANLSTMMQTFPDLLTRSENAGPHRLAVKRPNPNALLIHPLLLNLTNRTVKFVNSSDKVVTLSRGEAQVLYTLMQMPNRVLSCKRLVQGTWGYATDERSAQSIIRPYISRLRKKLQDSSMEKSPIQTVRSQGYMFIS